VIKFSESKEVEELSSVYYGMQHGASGDVKERLRKLEIAVEELKRVVFSRNNADECDDKHKKCSGRDLNPGHGIESRVLPF